MEQIGCIPRGDVLQLDVVPRLLLNRLLDHVPSLVCRHFAPVMRLLHNRLLGFCTHYMWDQILTPLPLIVGRQETHAIPQQPPCRLIMSAFLKLGVGEVGQNRRNILTVGPLLSRRSLHRHWRGVGRRVCGRLEGLAEVDHASYVAGSQLNISIHQLGHFSEPCRGIGCSFPDLAGPLDSIRVGLVQRSLQLMGAKKHRSKFF